MASAESKAHRLLTEGRLTVEEMREDGTIVARARGFSDGEMYALGYDSTRKQWRCTCPARSRCCHLIALQLVVLRPSDTVPS
jgi:uncharacterized Zn finger protein